MSKILVTGGAGFIGSHLVDKLIEKGHNLLVIDNLSTGFKEHINKKAKFQQMDIRSVAIDKIIEKEQPTAVYHLAAQVDVRKSLEDPNLDVEINISGSINLLKSCIKHKVDKVIFASTGGAIYGEQEYFPADENHPAFPISPYGVAKLTVEKYLHCFYENFGINYVSLRLANVYGPRQNPKGDQGVVAIFCGRLVNGEKVTIYGDGTQTRDYVYVDDVVRAFVSALDYGTSEIFNIGTGIETDVNRLYETLSEKVGSNSNKSYGPARLGEQRRSVIDFAKAKKELDWEPITNLKEGLEKTLEYYQTKTNVLAT